MAPNEATENDVVSNSNATSPVGMEKIDLSKAVAASLDYAQADPSHVIDHANWSPKTLEDWDIYKRQGVALREAADCKRDPDLRAAFELSRVQNETEKQEGKDEQRFLQYGKDVSTEKSNSPILNAGDETPARPSLADRIHELSLKVGSELPIWNHRQGDTYVYLDPPTQQPEQDDVTYAKYTERYKNPMLLKKETLLSFNSPFFDNLFGSTYQHRIRRRRHLVGNLPEHVKYVIDLTPPSDGDDAVDLMTEICCPEGVRKWFLANQRWAISKSLIGGEDEYMASSQESKRFTANLSTSGVWNDGVGYSPSPGFVNSQGVLAPLPVEYSSVRHRSGIERVLAAMQGLDPQLDSAPKVWTTFAVARHFGLTHSPLNDYIIRWIRAFPNTYFLEVNPEVSLKIADGLQCHDLCRDVFAILVGEEALATTRRNNDSAFGTRATVHGRKRGDLSETYQTRIEYASKAFVERVTAEFSFLVDKDMSWLDSVPAFSKLVSNGQLSADAANRTSDVEEKLKICVRGAIYKLLATNFTNMLDADQARFGNDILFPNIPWEYIWKSLPSRERLLTRSFWEALRHCYIFPGRAQLDVQSGWGKFCPLNEMANLGTTTGDHKLTEMNNIRELYNMVAELNYNWSISKGAPLAQISSLANNVPPDVSSTSSHPAADAHLGSDSGVGQIGPPGFNGTDEKHFDLQGFFSDAMDFLRTYATRMLEPPDSAMRAQSLELRLTNTLVNLTDAEWKFLPLWAGGNDDGSGGVFDDDIPLSHEGFPSIGPNVSTHSGSSLGASKAGFGGVRSFTITNTSLQTIDGSSDTSPQEKVGPADEGAFSAGHDFSVHSSERLSSDQSIVFVPSINGSSIAVDSDRTMITPSETKNDEGDKEEHAIELVREVEVDGSNDAPSKEKDELLDVEESVESFDSDDTFDFNDDYDLDTMDGDLGNDDDEFIFSV
ncbi:hypothetical protein MMC07_004498 [Pseudocyphellaria aurata]|nr:hypothetical protein [Pseudocyphellaria aurata]